MKTMTVTAILALLVGIPMVLRRCRAQFQPVRVFRTSRINKEERRYDIDDFIS